MAKKLYQVSMTGSSWWDSNNVDFLATLSPAEVKRIEARIAEFVDDERITSGSVRPYAPLRDAVLTLDSMDRSLRIGKYTRF